MDPTYEEFEGAIKKLQNGSAPGDSRATAEMLKALGGDRRVEAFELVRGFWRQEAVGLQDWKKSIMKVLYKGKGSMSEVSNYRGIALQELLT